MDRVILDGRPHFIWIFLKYIAVFIVVVFSVFSYFYFRHPVIKAASPVILILSATAGLILTIYYFSYGYKITGERIAFRSGIFNVKTKFIELYRVKDIEMIEPFFYRFFGLANIKITSSDHDMPHFVLFAQKKQLEPVIRKSVEEIRKIKGVREIDTV
ncbi:MAG TPA: PH domain-containing protein [bacterium]|nr:PH domain-containing protein [bacterium]